MITIYSLLFGLAVAGVLLTLLFGLRARGEAQSVEQERILSLSTPVTLEEMECRYIGDILRQTGWRIKGDGGAAQILGMNPATLYSRMKKLGISSQREKDGMSSLS